MDMRIAQTPPVQTARAPSVPSVAEYRFGFGPTTRRTHATKRVRCAYHARAASRRTAGGVDRTYQGDSIMQTIQLHKVIASCTADSMRRSSRRQKERTGRAAKRARHGTPEDFDQYIQWGFALVQPASFRNEAGAKQGQAPHLVRHAGRIRLRRLVRRRARGVEPIEPLGCAKDPRLRVVDVSPCANVRAPRAATSARGRSSTPMSSCCPLAASADVRRSGLRHGPVLGERGNPARRRGPRASHHLGREAGGPRVRGSLGHEEDEDGAQADHRPSRTCSRSSRPFAHHLTARADAYFACRRRRIQPSFCGAT
jgi:hypothetical protein